MDESRSIIDTMILQMGGRKFQAMTGAIFQCDTPKNKLVIKFKMCRKANKLEITLNSMDTYDLVFSKYSSKKWTCDVVQEYPNIYSDQLRNIFEEFTGLNTHL